MRNGCCALVQMARAAKRASLSIMVLFVLKGKGSWKMLKKVPLGA
jgi:hypothetical protein